MATPAENNKVELENSDSDTSFLSDVEEREASSLLTDNSDLYSNTGDDSSLNISLLPWERLADWIHCFCVVTFDLEIGQMIEEIYPSHVTLSEQDKTSICYLAFPDSNSGCMGDTQFHFRIRQSSANIDGSNGSSQVDLSNPLCPPAFRTDSSYWWGFAYFRQVKDKNLRRGYFQKSLVIVTRLPFVELFQELMAVIAPEFFDKGSICLEISAKEIDQWPRPVPGIVLNLPLLGTLFQVRIPSFSAAASPSFSTSLAASPSKTSTNSLLRRRCLIATDVDLYSALAPLLPHLQMLWELLLCGEPLVVMATSPSICSHVVQALVNLIHPLQYCLDYRPFFTIHDSEFKEYTGRPSDPPPSVLLGVTNPFFAKALQHWPHIIRIGSEILSSSTGLKIRASKSNVSSSSKMSECKPGVYTSYKPHLTRDKALLKLIAKGAQTRRPNQVQSALMRRHFLELTQSFIIPLERYFARLMPLQKSISPYKAVPGLSPFKAEEFLASVEHCGPQLTTGVKGDWTGLYRRFLRTPNFESWSQQRHQEANNKLRALQMDALSQSDITSWLQGKREVEVVDMVLRLREKLNVTLAEETLPVSPQTRLHLQGQLDTVLQSLPEDLRSVLKAS
uniref:EOG090X031T n=1 Tax=Daphnia similis TaxID=35528 RepID=A0A4Y7N362_9CRUS|nr:EOG090X031T [Daphnia similis]SVE87274.1 EOG090X031T [Daphnia similis]